MASRSIDLISKIKLQVQHALFFLISKKTNIHVQHAFRPSLPLFCTTTTLFRRTKTSNFLVTHFCGGIVVCAYPIFCLLCSCSLFFFTAAHFHLVGHQHFSLSDSRFEFSCFSSKKFASFVFNHSVQFFLCYPREHKHKKQRRERHDFVVVFSF